MVAVKESVAEWEIISEAIMNYYVSEEMGVPEIMNMTLMDCEDCSNCSDNCFCSWGG